MRCEIKNLTNEELLKELPIVDIGQITPQQRQFLNRQVEKGIVKKNKWYWNSMCIGTKKNHYYLSEVL